MRSSEEPRSSVKPPRTLSNEEASAELLGLLISETTITEREGNSPSSADEEATNLSDPLTRDSRTPDSPVPDAPFAPATSSTFPQFFNSPPSDAVKPKAVSPETKVPNDDIDTSDTDTSDDEIAEMEEEEPHTDEEVLDVRVPSPRLQRQHQDRLSTQYILPTQNIPQTRSWYQPILGIFYLFGLLLAWLLAFGLAIPTAIYAFTLPSGTPTKDLSVGKIRSLSYLTLGSSALLGLGSLIVNTILTMVLFKKIVSRFNKNNLIQACKSPAIVLTAIAAVLFALSSATSAGSIAYDSLIAAGELTATGAFSISFANYTISRFFGVNQTAKNYREREVRNLQRQVIGTFKQIFNKLDLEDRMKLQQHLDTEVKELIRGKETLDEADYNQLLFISVEQLIKLAEEQGIPLYNKNCNWESFLQYSLLTGNILIAAISAIIASPVFMQKGADGVNLGIKHIFGADWSKLDPWEQRGYGFVLCGLPTALLYGLSGNASLKRWVDSFNYTRNNLNTWNVFSFGVIVLSLLSSGFGMYNVANSIADNKDNLLSLSADTFLRFILAVGSYIGAVAVNSTILDLYKSEPDPNKPTVKQLVDYFRDPAAKQIDTAEAKIFESTECYANFFSNNQPNRRRRHYQDTERGLPMDDVNVSLLNGENSPSPHDDTEPLSINGEKEEFQQHVEIRRSSRCNIS